MLLALEEKAAGVALHKLREISPFDGGSWDFRVCGEAKRLLKEPLPGVLVLSRFLPGVEGVLEQVRRRFGQTRIVFLTGRVDERARAFMQRVRSLGFAPNFVTGDLPGDRPYPLPLALLHDYAEMAGRREELRKAAASYTAGRVAVLGRIAVAGCIPVDAARVRKIGREVAAVLVESGYPKAAARVRSWRRGGYGGPILVCGGYDLELIAAGATGSLADPGGVRDYLSLLGKEGGMP